MNDRIPTTKPRVAEQYRLIRRELFDELTNLFELAGAKYAGHGVGYEIPNEAVLHRYAELMLRYQRRLADRIIEAEKDRNTVGKSLAKSHITRMRCYGDCLLWSNFDPHSIDVLSRGGGHRPPDLFSQGEDLDQVFACAHEKWVSKGIPVIVSDLTNTIRSGDLLVWRGNAAPGIFEVKSGSSPMKSARAHRQLSRIGAAAEYLSNDKITVRAPSRQINIQAVEPKHSLSREWHRVAAVLEAANQIGNGWSIRARGDLLLAIDLRHKNAGICLSEAALDRLGTPDDPISIPINRITDRPSQLIPPCVWWPLADDLRWALSEDMILMSRHIDLAKIIQSKTKGGSILKIDRSKELLSKSRAIVDVNGDLIAVYGNHLTSGLFGMATIDSISQRIVDEAVIQSSFLKRENLS